MIFFKVGKILFLKIFTNFYWIIPIPNWDGPSIPNQISGFRP